MLARSLQHEGYRCLVLNADGQPMGWPLSLVPAKRAVKKLLNDRVIVLETWEDAFCRAGNVSIAVPKTVMLRQYVPIGGEPKFCRRSLLLRDEYRCGYCNREFPSHELSYDHVLPRSRGGKTEWTNIISACTGCNARKANRIDLKPIKMPHRPTNVELLRKGLKYLPNDIKETFGDYLYWGAELQP